MNKDAHRAGAVAGILLIFASVTVRSLLPDASAAAAVQRILPEAKRSVTNQLDLPAAHVRYTGAEVRRGDDLVILYFELRPFPYVAAEAAYLVSRCTPIDEVEPDRMGGGRGVTDFATDPELVSIRSEDQPACKKALHSP